MAAHTTPKFHNTAGVDRIETGATQFECIGALPPFDHPHIYLDMASKDEIICPYCSTVYAHNPDLKSTACNPAEAIYND